MLLGVLECSSLRAELYQDTLRLFVCLFLVAMVIVHAPSVLILSAVLITGDVSDAVAVEREPV
jgi:hypothetical protein